MLVGSEKVLFKISFFQISRSYKQIAFDFDTYLVILKLPSSILTQATTPGLYPVLYNRFRTNMYRGGIVTLGGYFRGRPLLASWLQSSLFTISSFKTYNTSISLLDSKNITQTVKSIFGQINSERIKEQNEIFKEIIGVRS